MSNTRRDRYIRTSMQDKHANYIKNQQKVVNIARGDKSVMKLGENWYWDGHKLEDANEDLINNLDFLNGYKRAARQDAANKEAYLLGKNFFASGISLHDIPEVYANNDHFIKGYVEALRDSLKEKKTNSKRR